MASHEFTSIHSPRIKGARRLAKRAFRYRERRFLAEGPQAVREALACADQEVVQELYATPEAEQRHPELLTSAGNRGVPVHRVSFEVMRELAQTVTPQGLLGVCGFVDRPLSQVSRPRLVVVLSHVRDPGNAGTVLRTADAAGADVVVFADASVDPYNGKCVRASAGSLFHVSLVVGVRASDALAELGERGIRRLAADGAGPTSLDTALHQGELCGSTAWVFGNEAWGLPAELREACDATVSVPIYGRAESLNLATAAAVCLYSTAREQRAYAADA